MIVDAHGLRVELPRGWSGRVFGRSQHMATLHAGDFQLPLEDGEFGAVATAAMAEIASFLALTEYLPGSGLKPGAGLFAPLRCAGRTYRHGERVPFTITVRITAAASVNGVIVATRLRATYVNRTRINLTPCVVAPGHDAATYRGQPATG